MPAFSYSAVTKEGSKSGGSLDARDRDEAFRKLEKLGLQPFKLVESSAGGGSKAQSREKTSDAARATARGGKIQLNQQLLVLFTESLSDLLSAGLQLEPALKILAGRGEKSKLRDVAAVLREKIREGSSLADALRSTSPSFSDLYCNLVSAGELSGSLDVILRRQSVYLTTMAELRGKVLTAMIYPAFLIFSGLLVTVVFITFLIPKLTVLINRTGGEPPFAAVAMMAISEFFQSYWWLILSVLGIGIVVFQTLISIPANRPTWDRIKLKLPLMGALMKTRFHVQMLETLSTVMANGLPMLKGLELSQNTTPNLFLRAQMKTITAEVGDGSSLSHAFERSGVFPALLVDLVRVGEQTGKMSESLSGAATRFDKELSKRIDRVSALIQPMIVVLMAGLVGFMAWIMISIIYDTISLIRTR
ncbi:MAG: type II secretory pathway component PulF [Verrucomicrobiales bacterium]